MAESTTNSAPSSTVSQREVVIRPESAGGGFLAELWAYRELFWTLASRTILARYKQTIMGVAWALIRPLMMVMVLTLLFNGITQTEEKPGPIPYPLMVFAGVLPWQLFANSLQASTTSTVVNSRMISKVYFPRIIIPASVSVAAVIDFLIASVVFICMMIYYRVSPQWAMLPLLFPLILLALAASLGAGLWFSALNVRYRDVGQAVPFLVQIGLLISPVGYRARNVPDYLEWIVAINPMVCVIDGFRWVLLGGSETLQTNSFVTSAAMAVLLFISGVWFFQKMERNFADVI